MPEYDEAWIQNESLKLFKVSGKKVKKFWWLKRQIQKGLKTQDCQPQFPQMVCLQPNQLSSYKDLVVNVAPLLKKASVFKLMLIMTGLDFSYFSDDSISKVQYTLLDLYSKQLKFSDHGSSVEKFQPQSRIDFVTEVQSGLFKIKRFCHFFSNGK